MLRLLAASTIAYVGYRVGSRILKESSESGFDADRVGWPSMASRPEDQSRDEPTPANDDGLTSMTESVLPGEIDSSAKPPRRRGPNQG